MVWYGTVLSGIWYCTLYGMIWYIGMVWHGRLLWYDILAWHGMVKHIATTSKAFNVEYFILTFIAKFISYDRKL